MGDIGEEEEAAAENERKRNSERIKEAQRKLREKKEKEAKALAALQTHNEVSTGSTIPELHPNQIVRYSEGRKYFGYGASQLAEKIKQRELPEPIPLSDTGYAKGWTGRQIIEHHRRLQALAIAKETEDAHARTSS